MVSFKEYFYEQVNPHHRRLSRLGTRTGAMRNGKDTGVNMMASRHKPDVEKNPNFDQNKTQDTGLISNEKAFDIISKHGLNPQELNQPKRLGKRPFSIQKLPTGYVINRIS